MNGQSRPTSGTSRDGWFKSSYSNALGSCVEVNLTGGVVSIRDSKDKRADSPVMSTGGAGWSAFLSIVATHPLSEREPGS
ncbi:MAG TPA: DUF397 domain-containing protein [Amycolatopsis sp.]|uniref:DUF397 domain-containing protein n=1 Tax=Amycolatopsis nalaikhensis TaxID=715472 RepID=A0ABY8Y1E8_9PSEU|nr:DUF397 domain-containing protein [Amycolatopsis sp. 2-2]WIV61820.1 DUF397 domain-containing protein [Amycolatopsis sp. 2-2]